MIMDKAKRIDKMNGWKEYGEDTLVNALKATVNKWDEVMRYADEANEMVSIACGMCHYFNGECDNCIMNDASLCLCNSDDKVYSLYNEIRKAGKLFVKCISDMQYALSEISYSDAYKDELRYAAIQKGEV
jgi:hypothetical protein